MVTVGLQNEYSAVEKCPHRIGDAKPNNVHGETIITTDTWVSHQDIYVPRLPFASVPDIFFLIVYGTVILGCILNHTRILLCLCCTTEYMMYWSSLQCIILKWNAYDFNDVGCYSLWRFFMCFCDIVSAMHSSMENCWFLKSWGSILSVNSYL